MGQEPRSTSNITEELNKLGNQVAEAIRLAWESEERRRLQTEITEGLQKFGDQVEEAMKKAGESEAAHRVREQAEQVASKAKETDVVDEVRDGLLKGLQALNRELSKLVARLETGTTERTETASSGTVETSVETGAVPPVAPNAPSQSESSDESTYVI